jgi:hypothetical protein
MEKYFDAFLYFANWGTHILKLRLPSKLLDPKTAMEYCSGDSAFVRAKSGKVILTFDSEYEDGDDYEEIEGSFAPLLQVRAELARGDLRALYLCWLLSVQKEEFEDEDREPPVPPGLGQLSASLENLAEFIRIDRDLLHVAAQSSTQMERIEFNRKEVKEWVFRLPGKEKDELIASLIMDADHSVGSMLQRFIRERPFPSVAAPPPPRMVGGLLEAAKAYSEERKRLEADKRAKEKAIREREAVLAREKHLDSLVGRESKLWAEVESLIATKQPKNYDRVVKMLVDLRDLDLRAKGVEFHRSLEALRQAHALKPSFLERLKKAGL